MMVSAILRVKLGATLQQAGYVPSDMIFWVATTSALL
jgi:hypothetical protein